MDRHPHRQRRLNQPLTPRRPRPVHDSTVGLITIVPRRPRTHFRGCHNGRFTWGPLSPAGNLERNGFFLRQFKRNGTRGAWAFVAQAKWVFVAIAAAVGGVMLVTWLIHVSA